MSINKDSMKTDKNYNTYKVISNVTHFVPKGTQNNGNKFIFSALQC